MWMVLEKAMELFYEEHGDDAPTPEVAELVEGGYIAKAMAAKAPVSTPVGQQLIKLEGS
jgi:hypothetical protein